MELPSQYKLPGQLLRWVRIEKVVGLSPDVPTNMEGTTHGGHMIDDLGNLEAKQLLSENNYPIREVQERKIATVTLH